MFFAKRQHVAIQFGMARACFSVHLQSFLISANCAQQDGLPDECALIGQPMQLPRVHAQQDGDRLFVVQYQILVQEHAFCIGVQPWILDGIAHMSVEHVRWNVPVLCLIRAVMLLQPLVLN